MCKLGCFVTLSFAKQLCQAQTIWAQNNYIYSAVAVNLSLEKEKKTIFWGNVAALHIMLRRQQWHTKWDQMFPWHSALKGGWCSQQLINALLTFSVMGNKLDTSNMKASFLRIFSHLLMSLDISEKRDLWVSNKVSHWVTDKSDPVMPRRVQIFLTTGVRNLRLTCGFFGPSGAALSSFDQN